MAKGKVTFKEEICKGCGLCTTNCPVNIVVMDTSRINGKGYNVAMISDMDQCIGCANCAIMCPDNVITVERF